MNRHFRVRADVPNPCFYAIWRGGAGGLMARDIMLDLETGRMRVLLADDHTRVRWALRTAIQEEDGMDIVGEVSEAPGLLAQVETLRPDVIVLEWELPGRPIGDLLADLRALDRPCQVIVLGQHPDTQAVALAAGADAFVSKADSPEQLLCALRGLVQGGRGQEGGGPKGWRREAARQGPAADRGGSVRRWKDSPSHDV